jgi:hypothetical protein
VREFPLVPDRAVCAELFGLCGSGLPIAVVDEQGRFRGVVKPLELLTRLGAVEVVEGSAASRPGMRSGEE